MLVNNKIKKRIAFVAILTFFFVSAVVIYTIYNKPHRNVKSEEAFVVIEASKLFDEFSENQQEANKKYLDKVIIVRGLIKEVITPRDNKSGATVVLEVGDEMLGVSCGFDNKESQNHVVGSAVSIKGICTGMAMDVVLNKCSIQNK